MLVKCKMSYIWTKKFKKDTNIESKPPNFTGRYYNRDPGINWAPYIPMRNIPIKYLEIGVADGGNALHIANSFCKHSESSIYCVDPWTDYDEYKEYKGKQEIGWETFNANIRRSPHFGKFKVYRGFSDSIVPTFEDNFFDIIFVDGNHETEYVYRDGIMAFNKVKSEGYIVFDDYFYFVSYWPETRLGIDRFLEEYSDKIKIINRENTFSQCIIQKL